MHKQIVYQLLFLGLLGLGVLSVDAQSDTAVNNASVTNVDVIAEQLDKLMSTWYAKKAEYYENSQNAVRESVTNNLTEDSLILLRLQTITSHTLFPMVFNNEIRSYIQMYIKRTRLLSVLLGLSKYYFPMFEQTLDKYGCPLELKYLAVIESALNPSAVSRAGATGLWQFMYNTGKMYGLEVNTLVDYRRDPIRATDAAARHLRDLNNMFSGDWVLAIAAYNCGPGNVKKAILRSGGKTNFWDIYQYLPKETRGYVPAFYGAWYAMKYYDKYGVEPAKMNFEQTDTFLIKTELHLMQIAEALNFPIDELRALNPQYKKDIIPVMDEPMILTLPINMVTSFEKKRDTLHLWNKEKYFSEGIIQPTVVPTGSMRTTTTAGTTSADGYIIQAKRHTIKKGESLSIIAKKYRTTVSELTRLNKIKANTTLYPGRTLIVGYTKTPAPKPKTPTPPPATPANNTTDTTAHQ
ncbi:MAG: transglycosylase SLT domain-containing protein [Bacteroidales bacterium]|jgi:soluble lytic murein transglycosylase-like protein/LysM repeat protein|nr:transglycosylase SLT domain-containing protein [Bacteroidales bacterium]